MVFIYINKNLRYTLIETNSVFYLTIYLTKLEQKNQKSSDFTNRKKIIRARLYSTSTTIINTLNPFFITGLTDAEGSFVCIIRKSTGHRLRWRAEVVFQIALHKKNLELLKQIQAFFGGIGIIANSSHMCAFRITSPKQISDKIIPHFYKYILITKKQADYLLFKEIVLLIKKGEHLKEEGLQSIINIRASLNLGLSSVLKTAFPNTIPIIRPLVQKAEIPHHE